MRQYLQANNVENKMQSNKSSHKSDAKRNHPNRLGYKTQSKLTKSRSPYLTDSAEMGPGYTNPSQNIQKPSHAIVLVRFD